MYGAKVLRDNMYNVREKARKENMTNEYLLVMYNYVQGPRKGADMKYKWRVFTWTKKKQKYN